MLALILIGSLLMYGEIGSQIGCLKMPSIFSTGYAIDSLLNCYKGKKNLKKKKNIISNTSFEILKAL